MRAIFAQKVTINGQKIKGPLDTGINNIGDVINRALLVIVPLAGVILFLVLIWGGYDFLLSGGNEERVKKGKAKITAGVVGFLLLILSYLMVKLISQIFGLGQEMFQ